jgi:hypothetical protein
VDDAQPPNWDQAFREVGLVALQAAVLARRIFTPTERHPSRESLVRHQLR